MFPFDVIAFIQQFWYLEPLATIVSSRLEIHFPEASRDHLFCAALTKYCSSIAETGTNGFAVGFELDTGSDFGDEGIGVGFGATATDVF